MAKGRNTTVIRIRVPDVMLIKLKDMANKRNIGYTTLSRHLLQDKLGMKKT